MVNTDALESLSELLERIDTCLVIVGSNPSYDQVATALAFSEALQASGKEVTLISPEEIPSEGKSLVGHDRFQYKLGNQSLSIKFPYKAEAVDKVSYHISDDEQTFYLMIKPQKGHIPLDSNQVTFDYVGAEADMIFLVGVHQLDSLDHLYEGFEELYERASLVTIHSFEPEIGNLKIDTSKYAAYSQAMVAVLQHLQLPLSADAATNLLAGIEMTTDGLSSSITTADTFEAVALLLRQGARRIRPHQKKNDIREVALEKNSDKSPKSESGTTLLSQQKEKTKSTAKTKINKNKTKKYAEKSPQPGDLDYQPGLEGSVGGKG